MKPALLSLATLFFFVFPFFVFAATAQRPVVRRTHPLAAQLTPTHEIASAQKTSAEP
jgi:hypothetical protein